MDATSGTAPWPPDDHGFAHSLIRRRAKRLLWRTGLPPTELDELEQQLTVDLWQSAQAFDPARGSWRAFATAAVSHSMGRIVRHQRADKRAPHRCQSLNVEVIGPSGEPFELVETITNVDASRHLGLDPAQAEIHADLSMDLSDATSTLPADLKQVIGLFSTLTKPEVIEATGMKRSTLNDRLKKVRKGLLESGFENYFEKGPSL